MSFSATYRRGSKGKYVKVERLVLELGKMALFFLDVARSATRRPMRLRPVVEQMEAIGVNSLFVVVLTGLFTGMVFAFQTYYAFRKFGAEGYVGLTLALSVTRELGPVLTGLMVTGRAGSQIATELGTMRVTEQIDALTAMALNPVKYLVVPRVVASLLMFPILTIISDFLGIVGGWLIAVKLLGVNEGAFIGRITRHVEFEDIMSGLVKALFFGLFVATICSYKGFHAKGGAAGVGRATTEAVVLSCVTILALDYILTSLLF